MTFDDGILTVYNITNTAQAGDRPVMGLEEKAKYYFGYDRIGVTRLYLAKQAAQEVSAVVNIPGWNIDSRAPAALLPGGGYPTGTGRERSADHEAYVGKDGAEI